MKYLFLILLLSGCSEFQGKYKPKEGDCVFRSIGHHALKVDKVLKYGYLLSYTRKVQKYDYKQNKEFTEITQVQLYRSNKLIASEYSIVDCEAQNPDLESVELK